MPSRVTATGRYPGTRPRRTRRHPWLRRLVAEHRLTADDLIWPIFVQEGVNRRTQVASMPGVERLSIDLLAGAVTEARDLGIPVTEQGIPRELLYIADEVFFTGTAAEVTPIRSVDKISVGKGTVGPITKAIQKEFYAIVNGEKPDKYKWLTPVSVGSKQPVGV